MTDGMPELLDAVRKTGDVLATVQKTYQTARTAHEEAVVAARKAGAYPSDVALRSPMDNTTLRNIARKADIPPATPGVKKRTY